MTRFFASDGLGLYYEEAGDGPAILCLAGLTRNCRDFDPLAQVLDGVRLIRMDYRGRGLSDHDPDPMNYAVPREAQDAIELLDHLGLEKAVILGTSRGGLIAMVLAATAPERLHGVVLNDVGPVISADGITRIMDYVGRKPAARTLDRAAQDLMAAMGEDFPGVPIEVWRRQAEANFVENDEGLGLRYDVRIRDALLAQAAAGPPPDLWPFFDSLRAVPTGVIRGANSDILTADTLAEMQSRNPALIARTIPDRGHAPFLDEAGSLEVIRAILKETA